MSRDSRYLFRILAAALVAATIVATPALAAAATKGAARSADLTAAIALFDAGKRGEAKRAFEAALERDPGSAEASFYLGRIAFMAEDTEGAIRWFDRAAAAEPDRSLYHMWLGRAYAQKAIRASNLKRPFIAPSVRKELEKAVALDPDNIDARFDLARFFILAPGLMGGSTQKALEQASEIRKRDPLQGHQCHAVIYQQQEKFDLAEKEYRDAVRERPGDRKAQLWLGLFLQDRGRYEEALPIFEALAKVVPPDRMALYQIGKNRLLSGKDLDRAVESFHAYLEGEPREGEPGLASAHYRLGMVYEKKGDKPLARREYAETLRLQPDHKDAKKALAQLG